MNAITRRFLIVLTAMAVTTILVFEVWASYQLQRMALEQRAEILERLDRLEERLNIK